MCQNIEDFNRGCALVFALLYQSFPVPANIDCTRIDQHDDLDIPPSEAEQRVIRRNAVYAETVQFLEDEGFIRCGSRMAPRSAYFGNVVLSSKGLAAGCGLRHGGL